MKRIRGFTQRFPKRGSHTAPPAVTQTRYTVSSLKTSYRKIFTASFSVWEKHETHGPSTRGNYTQSYDPVVIELTLHRLEMIKPHCAFLRLTLAHSSKTFQNKCWTSLQRIIQTSRLCLRPENCAHTFSQSVILWYLCSKKEEVQIWYLFKCILWWKLSILQHFKAVSVLSTALHFWNAVKANVFLIVVSA